MMSKKSTTPRPLSRHHLPAVLYARSGVQAQQSTMSTVAKKLRMCRAFARQEGFEIIGEFADVGMSALNTNRPGLRKALRAVKGKSAQVLICYAYSDLSRRMSKFAKLWQEIEDSGGIILRSEGR